MILKNIKKISELETIEEKSFWVMAPTIAILGLTGLGTASFYGSSLPTIISAILCLVFPVILIIFVYKKKNYHYAYPLLCISIGAISVPLTFVFSGGFLSGMPLFCVVATAITALCYSTPFRIIALVSCLLGNGIAFFYVYQFGTPFPLDGQDTIYNDIIFGYFAAALGTFFAINLIINEVRRYKISQEAFQQYFDIEVRKEILSKALNGNLELSIGNKKAVILFADISNFTSITEKMPSELIGKFLNEFFSLAGKYIHNTNGIIDKYIGDCIMAYWFDNEGENCVLEAVKAVLSIKQELYSKAEMIYEKYGTELNFSAGISYGDIIFGDIGSDTMHDYTVIGDAVNTASRIEGFSSAGEILLSDAAAEMVKDSVMLENIESNMYFKGKNSAVNLFRVKGIKADPSKTVVSKASVYGYSLYICGCRGSFPVSGLRFSEYGGETSCYVLKKDDYAVVIDCGTGLKNAVDILSDCKKIDILLTHVHYDHILGLLMSKLPDTAEIRMFGYFNAWKQNYNTLEKFMDHPYWPVEVISTNNISVELEQEIKLNDEISATFYASDHPDQACVIKLMCLEKKICFFADCEDVGKIDSSVSKDSFLLFYDGMFDDNDVIDHTGWGHGSWQKGVRFARDQNIQRLIITHHDPEIGDHTLLTREQMARSMSRNVSFAKSGDRILI